MLPLEYKPLEAKITIRMGRAMGEVPNNHKTATLDFALQGWVAAICLLGLNGEDIEVVDFEKYLIKCHFCGNMERLLRDCQSFFAHKTSIKWSKRLYNQ
jgi:hypothetical protein